jgi:hypothetical protein
VNRSLVIVLSLASCADDVTQPWQLDHDRVVAVRSVPPGLAAGETARIEALVAMAGGSVRVVEPQGASAPTAPAGLFVAVRFDLDHWEINAPDDERLAEARAELGLAATAPVPLHVIVQVAGPLYAQKTVWLGAAHDNPELPRVALGGVPASDEIELFAPGDLALVIEASERQRVRWLTSCGELVGHDQPIATLRVSSSCVGELAAVVRDDRGGVVWSVWPLRAR